MKNDVLLCNGEVIRLGKDELKLLKFLAYRKSKSLDEPVNREAFQEEIFQDLWGITIKEDRDNSHYSRMTTAAGKLRKKMKTKGEGKDYISDSPYRLLCDVKEIYDTNFQDNSDTNFKPPTVAFPDGADRDNCPYPGIESYSKNRSADFFGRESEILDLTKLITESSSQVVFLFSQSGAGKTSIINAGLHPVLSELGYNVLPTARVNTPTGSIKPDQNPYTLAAITNMEDEIDLSASSKPITWANYLAKKAAPKTVLVIDQLEEIVHERFDTSDSNKSHDSSNDFNQKKEFFLEIGKALEQNPSLKVILAARAEYFDRLERICGELSKNWALYSLNLLTRDEAERAISYPAKRYAVEFAPEVLPLLVTKLCDRTGVYVEPLQLQLVCRQLWSKLAKWQKEITVADFLVSALEFESENEELHAEKIISRFAKSVLDNFWDEAVKGAQADSQAEAESICLAEELIDLGCRGFISEKDEYRIPVQQKGEWTGDLPNTVIKSLMSRRLLRKRKNSREEFYELAHDTLIAPVLERENRVDDQSLYAVFSEVARKIAKSKPDSSENLDETEIIQNICLTFIAEDGTRREVLKDSPETYSKISVQAIELLVRFGILRKISSELGDGYKITHRRIAQAIRRKLGDSMNARYHIHKLFSTYVSKSSAMVWGQVPDGILKEVEEVVGFDKVSQQEAAFILMSAFHSGYNRRLKEVIGKIGKRFPDLTSEILTTAAACESEVAVQRNAAYALRIFEVENRDNLLLKLVLDNPYESIRQTSAHSIAELGSLNLWQHFFELLNNPAKRAKAVIALSWIYDTVKETNLIQFKGLMKRQPYSLQLRLNAKLFMVRVKKELLRIAAALTIALISTILVTVPPRAFLAAFNWTITQVSQMGVFKGIFQGIVGAVMWSLSIGGTLLVFWLVAGNPRSRKKRYSPLIGFLGGLTGGIINTFIVISVLTAKSLFEMNWIPNSESQLVETVTRTGVAFVMPVYGGIIGFGVGMISRWMLEWQEENLNNQKYFESASLEIREIIFQTVKNSWMLLLPILAAFGGVHLLLLNMPAQLNIWDRLFGEAVSDFFGGIGLVIGLFIGLSAIEREFPTLDK